MRFTRFAFVLAAALGFCAPAGAFTVGEMSRPTFGTAPQGDVRPGTASSGSARPGTVSTGDVRPVTQPGNSGNRFTEPTGDVRPVTPAGLSSQRFTPSSGPVRPGLDAAEGRAAAFNLAPKPSGGKNAAAAQVTVKQAEGAKTPGMKAAKLGGGADGMGGMTASQQAERESVAKNSQAAAALNRAKDQKAVEQDSMAKIKGLMDAVNNKNSKIDQKASAARK